MSNTDSAGPRPESQGGAWASACINRLLVEPAHPEAGIWGWGAPYEGQCDPPPATRMGSEGLRNRGGSVFGFAHFIKIINSLSYFFFRKHSGENMHRLCRYIKIHQSLCLSWTAPRPRPHRHEDAQPQALSCLGDGWGGDRGGSIQVWGRCRRHLGLLGRLAPAAAGWEPQPQ